MNVDDFVKESILQIMKGVQDAQDAWRSGENKGHINPVWGGHDGASRNMRDISFDIAVTATETSTSCIKGGLKVVAVGEFGGSGDQATKNESVSRLTFSVPILPPVTFISET
ncbi:hypothetical protein [Caulobacter sp. LARHSG274]